MRLGIQYGEAYGLSRKAPSAASCRPPGTGCSRESKVVGFVMRFTESERMSFAARKPNSTPWMADEVGWWVFMLAGTCLALLCVPSRAIRAQRPSASTGSSCKSAGSFFGARKSLARV